MSSHPRTLPADGIRLDRSSPVPLYQQLYRSLTAMIGERRQLAPGTPLPASRALAQDLGVSRNTVLKAYEQLQADGHTKGLAGGGTVVTSAAARRTRAPRGSALAEAGDRHVALGEAGDRRSARSLSRGGRRMMGLAAAPADHIPAPGPWDLPFAVGVPALDVFPVAQWTRLYSTRLRTAPARLLAELDSFGYRPLRETIASQLALTRGVRCDPSQVLVTEGPEHAVALLRDCLLDHGDEVLVEDPGHRRTRAEMARTGAVLRPVPVDEHGMRVEWGLEHHPDARLALVTPGRQFPTGAVLSARRREKLLAWADTHQAWIIEHDPEGIPKGPRPRAALQAGPAGQNVVYVGAFGATLFPGVRIGYCVLPEALVDPMSRIAATFNHGPSLTSQATVNDFVSSTHFAAHVDRLQTVHAERRAHLTGELRRYIGDTVRHAPIETAGTHLVSDLPPDVAGSEVQEQACALGITLRPLHHYCLAAPARDALVLGFGCVRAPTATYAIRRLSDVIHRLTR
ncbi:PLP-dependent aminotransferase family protein [Streptomyces sp. NPDC088785]|uniref:aminotransferase-like domain-containing protein n=1 Tax=Streptomyces sp. NPDC088785 TaxID=3365897 RepID=UPI0038116C16